MTRKLKTKSAVLKKFAKEHGLKFKDIKLVELKPEDLAGVPRYRNPLYERQADWDDLPHKTTQQEEKSTMSEDDDAPKKRYHDDEEVYLYKANLLWSGFDTNARAGCRLGLFPYPELTAAEKEGYESQKLCTAIMRLARAS